MSRALRSIEQCLQDTRLLPEQFFTTALLLRAVVMSRVSEHHPEGLVEIVMRQQGRIAAGGEGGGFGRSFFRQMFLSLGMRIRVLLACHRQ